MNAKRYLLVGVILGGLIGWVLGYLRLPYFEQGNLFFLGLIIGLATATLGFLVLSTWKKKHVARAHGLAWLPIAILFLAGGVTSSLLLLRQNVKFKERMRAQQDHVVQQAEMIASSRNSELVPLMANLMQEVDAELKSDPARVLRNETIARIAALSQGFQPYRYMEADTLSGRAYSRERGQLLLALVAMQPDSGTMHAIMQSASFAGADLRGADLTGVQFSGANLRGAILKGADLTGANLESANLIEANLWGSRLNRAKLCRATLRRADLAWSEQHDIDLSDAELNGANFTAAKMPGAILNGATSKWAVFSGADLRGADLGSANLWGADFTKATLVQATLENANLTLAKFTTAVVQKSNLINAVLDRTDLTGTDLDRIMIGADNWIDQLLRWQVKGVGVIMEMYNVVQTTNNLPGYYLQKK